MDPLVLSGETRDNSKAHRIQATPNSVQVIYPSVRTLNFKPRGFRGNMRKEFETINFAEIRHMTRMIEDGINRRITTINRTNRFRIGA